MPGYSEAVWIHKISGGKKTGCQAYPYKGTETFIIYVFQFTGKFSVAYSCIDSLHMV